MVLPRLDLHEGLRRLLSVRLQHSSEVFSHISKGLPVMVFHLGDGGYRQIKLRPRNHLLLDHLQAFSQFVLLHATGLPGPSYGYKPSAVASPRCSDRFTLSSEKPKNRTPCPVASSAATLAGGLVPLVFALAPKMIVPSSVVAPKL